eukprot:706837_1
MSIPTAIVRPNTHAFGAAMVDISRSDSDPINSKAASMPDNILILSEYTVPCVNVVAGNTNSRYAFRFAMVSTWVSTNKSLFVVLNTEAWTEILSPRFLSNAYTAYNVNWYSL